MQEVASSAHRCAVSTSEGTNLSFLNCVLLKEWPHLLRFLSFDLDFICFWRGHSWSQCANSSVKGWSAWVSLFSFPSTCLFYSVELLEISMMDAKWGAIEQCAHSSMLQTGGVG